ncbi:MAG: hypothetical protein ACKO7W_04235 [Elainella sp.]
MRQSQPRILGIPRRIWLRWVSVYFMLLSLMLVIGGVALLGDGDGALAGIGSPAAALAILVGLLNFGMGGLGLLLSCWRGRSSGGVGPDRSQALWPRRRGLRWLYQAAVGLVSAVLLYGLGTGAGLVAVVFVVQNWASWWYGWRMPQVQLGDSRQQVESLVGRGSFRTDCASPNAKTYSHSTDLSRCVSLTLYTEFNRVGWEIGYDAADRVVSKQRVRRD